MFKEVILFALLAGGAFALQAQQIGQSGQPSPGESRHVATSALQGGTTNQMNHEYNKATPGDAKIRETQPSAISSPDPSTAFTEGVNAFLKGKGNSLSASELMQVSIKNRMAIIENLYLYSITKGVVTQSQLDELPASSRLIVLEHPELFEVQ